LMIAPRGSGKTTLMLNLITKFFKGYFHRIIVFSPTMHGDGKWETVKKMKGLLSKYSDPLENDGEHQDKKGRQEDSESESEGEGNQRNDGHAPSLYASSWHSLFAKVTPAPVPALWPSSADHLKELAKKGSKKAGKDGKKKWTGKLEKKDLYTDYWEDDLTKIMTETMGHLDKLRKKGHPKHKGKRTMILFDDLVGSNLFSNKKENPFRRLNATMRHYSVSALMATQAYKEVPKTVRVNATFVILFDIANQQELHSIYEECNVGMTLEQWMQVYRYCTAEPYSFMLINYQKPKGQRVWKRFEEMVPTPANDDNRLELQKQASKEEKMEPTPTAQAEEKKV